MSFDPGRFLKDFDGGKIGALVETMALAADADGEFSDEERALLAGTIRQLVAGTRHEAMLGGTQLDALLAQSSTLLAREGRDRRLQAVKEQLGDADARKGALGLAVSVTAADGIVRTSEREFILEMAEALDIDRDEAADLVKAVTRRP
jgi:tellurite resistance protein